MKRGIAFAVAIGLAALLAWWIRAAPNVGAERTSREIVAAGAAPATPRKSTLPVSATSLPRDATSPPSDAPTGTADDMRRAREFVESRTDLLRGFDAALRFGDPFPFVPALQAMAQAGDTAGARRLHELMRDCLDPKRKNAVHVEAEGIESAARVSALSDSHDREREEARARHLASRVANARAMDSGCAKFTRTDLDTAWSRVVELAQTGKRNAQDYVALEVALRYTEMVEAGRLAPDDALARDARRWLLAAASRRNTTQRWLLADSYCDGGLLPRNPVECYAWRMLLSEDSGLPGRPPSQTPDKAAERRILADALTPADRARAEQRLAELRACCR